MASLTKEQLWVSIFHKQANLSNYKIKIRNIKTYNKYTPQSPHKLNLLFIAKLNSIINNF